MFEHDQLKIEPPELSNLIWTKSNQKPWLGTPEIKTQFQGCEMNLFPIFFGSWDSWPFNCFKHDDRFWTLFWSGCLQGNSRVHQPTKKTPQIKEVRRVPGLSLRISIETNYLNLRYITWAAGPVPPGFPMDGRASANADAVVQGKVGGIVRFGTLWGMSLLQDPLNFHFCEIRKKNHSQKKVQKKSVQKGTSVLFLSRMLGF